MRECVEQAGVARKVRHDAQLDLRVVRRNQDMAWRRHEGLPDAASFRRADRDVLQVRVGRGQASCRRDGLVIRRVDAAGARIDLFRQLVRVRGAQFRESAVLQDDARQFELVRQLLEHVFGRRRLARGRLALHGQSKLAEQHFLQLLGGLEVEGLRRRCVRTLFEFDEAARQFVALALQHRRVDQHAVMLHVEQHRHEWLLDLRGTTGRVPARLRVAARACGAGAVRRRNPRRNTPLPSRPIRR